MVVLFAAIVLALSLGGLAVIIFSLAGAPIFTACFGGALVAVALMAYLLLKAEWR